MKINPSTQIDNITHFLKTVVKNQGFRRAIIAVSGGIDSAVSLSLAVKALQPKNIYSLQLPYQHQSISDSRSIIQSLNIPSSNQLLINIGPIVDQTSTLLDIQDKIRLGNLMARVRMITLFDQAKKLDALVIGTENKSEHLLGYYTRFGDQASDIEPLVHLYKLQVIEMAKFLKLPPAIIKKAPSANLWPGQTDQAELGFSYHQADPILHLYIDKHLSLPAIIARGFDRSLVNRVISRLDQNKFKQLTPYHL